MNSFIEHSTPIDGLIELEKRPIGDDRGFLSRVFCDDTFAKWGWNGPVRQINQTVTRQRGVLRGLHFQYPPACEDKLVSCLVGEIYDVAVDIRRGSPTFLHSYGTRLSGSNHRALLIPKGFAHGFQSLTDYCMILYLHSAAYDPRSEGGLNVDDPALDIDWPLPVSRMSSRDAAHPMITDEFLGIEI